MYLMSLLAHLRFGNEIVRYPTSTFKQQNPAFCTISTPRIKIGAK